MKKLLLLTTVFLSSCSTLSELSYTPNVMTGCTNEPTEKAYKRVSSSVKACFIEYAYQVKGNRGGKENFRASTEKSGDFYSISGNYSGETRWLKTIPGEDDGWLPFDDDVFTLSLYPSLEEGSCKTDYILTFLKPISAWKQKQFEGFLKKPNYKFCDAPE